ncbi:MAG: SRPBCC family protein [Alphaproteobacteria bacterium]|nr:SRPBCC family protein [Alphaproteobacteria bacterium]
MLRTILILIVVLLAGFIGYGLTLPDTTHVSRSITIAAPPPQVFAIVNSFKEFNSWSPWQKEMPAEKTVFEGPEAGVGAKMIWSGAKSGEGSQTIIESVPDTRVRTELDFGAMGKPQAQFELAAEGEGTMLTWSMTATHGYNVVSRYFGRFAVEPEVSRMYEMGLKDLKVFAETKAEAARAMAAKEAEMAAQVQQAATPSLMTPQSEQSGTAGLVTLTARPILYVTSSAPANDSAAIGQALGKAYGQIGAYMQKNGIAMAGAPLAITLSHESGTWRFNAAMPIASAPATAPTAEDGVMLGETPAGQAVKFVHKGPYSAMAASYDAIAAYMKANNLAESDMSFEEYVSDPADTPEADLITNIYYLTK